MKCSFCKQEGHNIKSCVTTLTIKIKKNATVSDAKLNAAWTHILTLIGYETQDEMIITAKTMKSSKHSYKGGSNQFEPRLLAYHTSSKSRPTIFKQHGLYLLPIENGTYIIQKNNIYMDLNYSGPEPMCIKKDDSSLVLKIGDSETSLIDNIRYSGIFELPEILGEPITHGPLMNGRHRLSTTMTLCGVVREIRGVQYETDSCYETKHKIIIIEAKSAPKEIDSFNIRQLYYPYRAIRDKFGDKKEIICAFIHKLGENIHIWLFEFVNPTEFLSIRQRAHYIYTFSL